MSKQEKVWTQVTIQVTYSLQELKRMHLRYFEGITNPTAAQLRKVKKKDIAIMLGNWAEGCCMDA
jgi:hypothetical protein